MAWNAPALCKAVTATTGTNNYVLSDPVTSTPHRTDAQAVADGSLVSGATIHYLAQDRTVLGDASFERGTGVYTKSGSTRTVARTAGNIIDSDAGPGVLKVWGSGQRDFIVLEVLDGSNIPSSQHAAFATNLGLARLIANTFTQGQVVEIDGAGLTATALDLRNSATSGSSNAIEIRFRCRDSGGAQENMAAIQARLATTTAGNESVSMVFRGIHGGAVSTFAEYSGGVFKDVAGSKFVAFPTGGTVKMLFSSVPPTGWTRVNETNQAVIRLATVSDTPNASGGSDSLFDGAWSTAGHTLTESQIPSHTHTIPGASGSGGSVDGGIVDGSAAAPNFASGATGGGGSHSHAMTTPYYRIACWATFD